jgi:hypothetical protein
MLSATPRRVPRRTALVWLAVIVALVVLLVGFRFASSQSSSKPVNQSPALIVGSRLTPRGWVPVDYGNLQVSVPSSWSEGSPCMSGGSYVLIGSSSADGCSPASTTDLAFVVLASWQGATGAGQKVEINGISMYERSGKFFIPSLGAQVSFSGLLSGRVERTMTRSPRAYVLGSRPPPAIPASWRRINYGGLSFDVPSTWPVRAATFTTSDVCSPPPTLGDPPSVVEYAGGQQNFLCPGRPASVTRLQIPTDGLIVQPGLSLAERDSFDACISVNGLSACSVEPAVYVGTSAYLSGYLVLKVTTPGTATPVTVEIGLGGDGQTARTILFSMRAAPASG